MDCALYKAFEVDHKKGRKLFHDYRTRNFIQMIEDRLAEKNIRLSSDVEAIHNSLIKVEAERHLYAHALWMTHPKRLIPVIKWTKGRWQRRGDKKAVSANEYPKPLIKSPTDMAATLQEIESLHPALEMLEEEIVAALEAWKKTSGEPSLQDRLRLGRIAVRRATRSVMHWAASQLFRLAR